jgi:hypothetical protein
LIDYQGYSKAVKRKRLMVCATARDKTFFFNCKNKIDRIPIKGGGWDTIIRIDQPLSAVLPCLAG